VVDIGETYPALGELLYAGLVAVDATGFRPTGAATPTPDTSGMPGPGPIGAWLYCTEL